MKKKNKTILFLILALVVILIPDNAQAVTKYMVCGTDKKFPYAIAELISTFMVIIKIAVPILLVISGMISFLKVTFAGNVDDEMKKAKSKLINNILAAVIIFFVISIVNFAVSLVAGKGSAIMDCVNCFISPEKCPTVDENDKYDCPGFINSGVEYDENCNPINK